MAVSVAAVPDLVLQARVVLAPAAVPAVRVVVMGSPVALAAAVAAPWGE